jgi:hypothetical protein
MTQRVAVCVDDDDEAELAQLLDEVGVDVAVDPARQRAREDDDRRAAREVDELVAEELELAGADGRAALVDLRLARRCSCATPRGCGRSR